jgi:hypothetical protein
MDCLFPVGTVPPFTLSLYGIEKVNKKPVAGRNRLRSFLTFLLLPLLLLLLLQSVLLPNHPRSPGTYFNLFLQRTPLPTTDHLQNNSFG